MPGRLLLNGGALMMWPSTRTCSIKGESLFCEVLYASARDYSSKGARLFYEVMYASARISPTSGGTLNMAHRIHSVTTG